MGLFHKKSHTASPVRPATQPLPATHAELQPQAQAQTGKPPKPGKQPKPGKRPKGLVRGVVDPADLIALRFEMVDLRARLGASEQSKAAVETRLAALDAGNAMAQPPRDPADGGVDAEASHRMAHFEAQLGAVVAAAAAASATAENVAAKAMAAVAALTNNSEPAAAANSGALPSVFAPAETPLAVPAGPVGPDPGLLARIDALTAMVDQQYAALPDPTLGARLEELMSRIDAAPDESRLVELEARMESSETRARQTSEHLIAIEHRMNTVSIELTNQVSELGRDIDGFGAHTSSHGNGNGNGNGHAGNGSTGYGLASAELLTELQAAQIKLAAEQARYEIAFRQDLAMLAEHVRRAKS